MAIVLQGLNHYATAYLDDILIYSETLEDHLIHLQNVFDRLREHGLKLKLKKCSFLQSETHYLGFIINSRGIQPAKDKGLTIAHMCKRSKIFHRYGIILS